MARVKKVHLLRLGFEPGKALQEALVAMEHEIYGGLPRDFKLDAIEQVLEDPKKFEQHPVLGLTAKALLANLDETPSEESALRQSP
ncbi:MAG: hypothetical protein AAFU33_26000, partial [Bacteroidota bacterium]